MKPLFPVLAFCLATFLASCSHTAKGPAFTKVETPNSNESLLYVVREGGAVPLFKAAIDFASPTSIGKSGYQIFKLKPGFHNIQLYTSHGGPGYDYGFSELVFFEPGKVYVVSSTHDDNSFADRKRVRVLTDQEDPLVFLGRANENEPAITVSSSGPFPPEGQSRIVSPDMSGWFIVPDYRKVEPQGGDDQRPQGMSRQTQLELPAGTYQVQWGFRNYEKVPEGLKESLLDSIGALRYEDLEITTISGCITVLHINAYRAEKARQLKLLPKSKTICPKDAKALL